MSKLEGDQHERRPGGMLISDEAKEEFDMRRKLITKARKGDRKAQDRLYELYKVRFYPANELGSRFNL